MAKSFSFSLSLLQRLGNETTINRNETTNRHDLRLNATKMVASHSAINQKRPNIYAQITVIRLHVCCQFTKCAFILQNKICAPITHMYEP